MLRSKNLPDPDRAFAFTLQYDPDGDSANRYSKALVFDGGQTFVTARLLVVHTTATVDRSLNDVLLQSVASWTNLERSAVSGPRIPSAAFFGAHSPPR
jgi:hypothetical protein